MLYEKGAVRRFLEAFALTVVFEVLFLFVLSPILLPDIPIELQSILMSLILVVVLVVWPKYRENAVSTDSS